MSGLFPGSLQVTLPFTWLVSIKKQKKLKEDMACTCLNLKPLCKVSAACAALSMTGVDADKTRWMKGAWSLPLSGRHQLKSPSQTSTSETAWEPCSLVLFVLSMRSASFPKLIPDVSVSSLKLRNNIFLISL